MSICEYVNMQVKSNEACSASNTDVLAAYLTLVIVLWSDFHLSSSLALTVVCLLSSCCNLNTSSSCPTTAAKHSHLFQHDSPSTAYIFVRQKRGTHKHPHALTGCSNSCPLEIGCHSKDVKSLLFLDYDRSDRRRDRERYMDDLCDSLQLVFAVIWKAGVPSNVTDSLRLIADRRSPDFISRLINISQTTSGGYTGQPAVVTNLEISVSLRIASKTL